LFADDGFQYIAGLRNLREIDLGFDPVSIRTAGTRRLGGSLGFAGATNMGPHLRGFVFFNGTGMGLLLGDANRRQSIENDLAFNFQLSGQIVDSNLTHPPFLSSDCPAKSS
jgi:hypothetical protein